MTHPTPLPAVDADVAALVRRLKAHAEDCSPHPRYSDSIIAFRNECTPANVITLIDTLTAAQARAEAVEWISVDERLPEKNTEVLVAFKGIEIASTGQYTGSEHDKDGWCYPSENNGCGEDYSDPVVIAWQPLPATDSAIGGKGA